MILKDVGCDEAGRMRVAQDKVQWWVVMNSLGFINGREFLD